MCATSHLHFMLAELAMQGTEASGVPPRMARRSAGGVHQEARGVHRWHADQCPRPREVSALSSVKRTSLIACSVINMSEVNFLCVHKKLRSKRLTPVLIKEVTRQCNLKGVFQALYTSGTLLPTPVSVCKYYHRCLNVPKLVNVRFTHVPQNQTLARMIRLHKVPDRPRLERDGLREMEEKDVPEVTALYEAYMKRFGMAIVLTEEEAQHHFLSGRGIGPTEKESWRKPRDQQVVWTYVVEVCALFPRHLRITAYFLPAGPTNTQDHRLLLVLLTAIDDHEPPKVQRPERGVSVLLRQHRRVRARCRG